MPTMHIYQAKKRPIVKEFKNKFFITRESDEDKLFWEADEEQDLSKRGGVFHIWILGASSTPIIAFVRPEWRLIIDGILLKQGFYEQINVGGRTVELQYNDYRFICSFPASEVRPATEISCYRPN